MIHRTQSRLLLLLAALWVVGGCAAQPLSSSAGKGESDSLAGEVLAAQDAAIEASSPDLVVLSGSGTVDYETDETLTPEQEKLLLDYMNLYYQSLADLNAGDPTPLFSPGAADQALARESAWRTTIEVRSVQPVDLSLTAFFYRLTCTAISINSDGDLSVSVREYAIQNFAAYPGVDSESHNVMHRFTLTQTAQGWRLAAHSQMDSANRLALGSMMRWGSRGGSSGDIDADTYLAERLEEVLAYHTDNLAERARQATAYNLSAGPALVWQYDYDREAAVAYALGWVETRNTGDWPSYDRLGGNCANYTSQCLLAGGIPMDHYGTDQWKWYGSSPNTAQAAAGRSGSWSAVTQFYNYAAGNSGYGLVADADASYAAGEPGDLIQLGYEDDWRHVVIIADVLRDENGKAIDYLICSNTADLRSFPVSTYMYPRHRLIKIYGWNGF